jgi:hypothetical protein
MGNETAHHDASSWKSREFPGVNIEAFRTLNAWAEALKEWDMQIRAMVGIMELKFDVTGDQFKNVVQSIKAGDHSKDDIQKALDRAKGSGGIGGASDVVGHPPDPPFQEPIS